MWSNDHNIRFVVVSDGVGRLPKDLFRNCVSVESVKLPSSLWTIGDRAFLNCSHGNLSIDVPETVYKIGAEALCGCRIRLPTSLKLLSNFTNSRNVLHQVKSVAISSKVDLKKLVTFIQKLPQKLSKKQFLDPQMMFKVLHSRSPVAVPPMNLHIHESFFSVDFTVDELKSFHNDHEGLLPARVKYEFTKTISTYAALLRCKRRELPESILYEILPFLGGESLPRAMLNEIVTEVGRAMKKQEGPELRRKVRLLESDVSRLASENSQVKIENAKLRDELNTLRRECATANSSPSRKKRKAA